jgi:hypothetical protein
MSRFEPRHLPENSKAFKFCPLNKLSRKYRSQTDYIKMRVNARRFCRSLTGFVTVPKKWLSYFRVGSDSRFLLQNICRANLEVHAFVASALIPEQTTLKDQYKNNSNNNKLTPWPESASELHRASDRRLSAKLVPTFANRRCHEVSVTDAYGRILGFLDRNRYFFFQVAPQLYSRG